jgi:hypothetical protein
MNPVVLGLGGALLLTLGFVGASTATIATACIDNETASATIVNKTASATISNTVPCP